MFCSHSEDHHWHTGWVDRNIQLENRGSTPNSNLVGGWVGWCCMCWSHAAMGAMPCLSIRYAHSLPQEPGLGVAADTTTPPWHLEMKSARPTHMSYSPPFLLCTQQPARYVQSARRTVCPFATKSNFLRACQ
mmetsp:Transcript_45863/g.81971  ORF Transcript_45863/g.81971 Transcript_45863/m.81971 type:complete len:132 (-) Transcript_45863:261-656(-)